MWLDDRAVAHLRDVAEWPDVGERYDVRGRLGRGGMGVVYRGFDRHLDREVAIKVLDAVDPSPDAVERLRREAAVLALLEHPGIVPVYDAGTLADGRAFYVMRLVQGRGLDVSLDGCPFGERLELFLRVCDAVAFAHAQGIVHRDLKPQNVMLGRFGEILVMDWGAALTRNAVQEEGVVAGTPGFMAPEQAAAGAVDARADIHALGVLLRGLFDAPVPSPIAAIASHATESDPTQRYQSVDALARDVSRVRDGERVSVHRESLHERTVRIYRRHRVPILLVAAYVVMRTVLLVWSGR